MKINFERFQIYTNIEKTQCTVLDIKKELANLIYNNAPGLPYHALAMKIYNSKGVTEYNDEECELLLKFGKTLPLAYANAINELINKPKEK